MNYLAIFLSAAFSCQQNEPQQPPKYERLRPIHRAPEEDTFFNLGPVMFKGVEFHVGWAESGELEMNVPDAVAAKSQGFNPPFVVSLEHDDMRFEADEFGATFDLNLLRLSIDGMRGRWQGDGVLTINDGIDPPTTTSLSLHGDFWAARGSGYWPALRLREDTYEICFGPEVSVSWFYEGLHGLDQSPLPLKDKQDELVGGIGPRLSYRLIFRGLDVSLDGRVPYLFGAITGMSWEVTAGVGIRF